MPIIQVGISSNIGHEIAIANSKKILEEIFGELLYNLNYSISIKFVLLMFLGIMGLIMIVSLLMILRLKDRPLLEFFSMGKKKKTKILDTVDSDIVDTNFHADGLSDVLSFDNSGFNVNKGKNVLRGYGKKHISRSIIATTLIIIVIVLLIGTLAWLNNIINSNQVFIEKTIAETTVFGELQYVGDVKFSEKDGITEDVLNKVLETDLVEDYFGAVLNEYDEINIDRYGIKETVKKEGILNLAYYERNPDMTILASNKELNSDSGIRLLGVEDQSIIDKINSYNPINDEIPILASNIAMDTYDLEIGHKVALRDSLSFNQAVYGTIVGTFEGYVFPRYDDTQIEWIPDYRYEMFIYPMDAVRIIERSGISYEKISILFNKERNKELYDNREEILSLIAKDNYSDYNTGYKLVLYDDILTETIKPLEKNLELLSIIYPIILILSMIIAAALPYLIILRRNEELAIMRILGVREKEVKGYVFNEYLSLVILGEVIVMAVISVITIKSGVYPIGQYFVIIVGYLLASIIGILASLKNLFNKKLLDILQVKE